MFTSFAAPLRSLAPAPFDAPDTWEADAAADRAECERRFVGDCEDTVVEHPATVRAALTLGAISFARRVSA